MKILSTDQTRAADDYTISNEPIKSIDLMERASRAFVNAFVGLPLPKRAIKVICGIGNNGGDGMAIARKLKSRKFEVEVWALNLGTRKSPDFISNERVWSGVGNVININGISDLPKILKEQVVIDAIFGSGISREITGMAGEVISQVNQSGAPVVAVDIPSGLFADQPQSAPGPVMEATYTLSFQTPKLAFFLPQNDRYVGKWQILDIGLSPKFMEEVATDKFALDPPLLLRFQNPSSKFAHKGTFGHALLVAGSKGKMGASILAARAALRCGAGLLTAHTPGSGNAILQTAVPEAMTQIDEDDGQCTNVPLSESITAAGVGPGLGTGKSTVQALRAFLEKASFPLVIDADGLNMISEHRELMEIIPPNSIITPHPKEFQRLAGSFSDDYQRLHLQKEMAVNHRLIVVYKGAHSTIALPDGTLYFNTTGNPGMATAGSGDVLTGMITGLLTRHNHPQSAALLGVYLHGLAGDLAAEEVGQVSVTATDIINQIGTAFKRLGILL